MGRILLGWTWVAVIVAGLPAAARGADHPVSFPTGPLPGAYSPSSVEAGVGDTVTFSGAFASHPLVWTDGDFATRSSGTTNTYTFVKPGTFRFHCQIHATMTGVVHVPGNQTAAPDFTWSVAGTTVTFTASGSDPDGSIVRFEWDTNGDNTYDAIGSTVTKTYDPGSTQTVRLRYVDDSHETSPATAHVVTVGGSPPPPGTPGGGTGGGGGGGGPAKGGGTTGGGTTPSPSPVPGGDGTSTGSTSPGGGGQGGDHGTGSPGIRVATSALAFRHGRATVSLKLSIGGDARVRIARGKTTLATGSASRLRSGTRRVTVKLTRAGTRALRHGKRVRATLTVTLRRSSGGRAVTARRIVTVRT